jgi:hypothetical protein
VGAVRSAFGAVPAWWRGASGMGASLAAPRVSGADAGCATDGAASAESAGAAECAGAAGTSGDVGVVAAVVTSAGEGTAVLAETVELSAEDMGALVSLADTLVSLVDGGEPVCAPPELCTIPERGSVVDAESGDDEPAVPEELVDSDDAVEAENPVDDEPEGESDDELDADEEESDDELEELDVESGSANATPGVLATAAPTPSATANAPTRPIYFAVPIVVPSAGPPCMRWPI